MTATIFTSESVTKGHPDKVCDIIGRTREEVFVVPGNHDLNRKAAGNQIRELLNAALAFAPNNEAFLEEILKSNELRMDLFTAFADYNSFANNFFCQERLMNKCIKCFVQCSRFAIGHRRGRLLKIRGRKQLPPADKLHFELSSAKVYAVRL